LIPSSHVFRFESEDNLSNFAGKPEGRGLVVIAVVNILFTISLFGQATEYVDDEHIVPLLALFCLSPTIVFFSFAFISGTIRIHRWAFILMFGVASLNFFADDGGYPAGGYPYYFIGGVLTSLAYWLVAMRWKANPVYVSERERPTTVSYVIAWILSGFIPSAYYGWLSTMDISFNGTPDIVEFLASGIILNIVSSITVYSFFSQLRLILVMPYLWGLGLLGVAISVLASAGNNPTGDGVFVGTVMAVSLIMVVTHNLLFYFFFKSKGRMRHPSERTNIDTRNASELAETFR
jgi:hypothetical protein